jgi:hypothetical protein
MDLNFSEENQHPKNTNYFLFLDAFFSANKTAEYAFKIPPVLQREFHFTNSSFVPGLITFAFCLITDLDMINLIS